jgi:uncharacterized protein
MLKWFTRLCCSALVFASVGALAQEPQMGSEGTVTQSAASDALQGFGGTDGVFRFVVVGDVLAKGLGAGLTRLTTIDQRFETVNRFNESSGLARVEVYDWTVALPKILTASEVDGVVVLIGTNDRQPIRVGEQRFEFGTPEWTAAYEARVDGLLGVIKAAGAKAFWVNLPPMAKPNFDADMKVISDLQSARVVAAGVNFIDIRPIFSSADGAMLWQDTDPNGNPRRLRTREGIAFTRQGNDVVADVVMKAMLAAVSEDAPKLPDAAPVVATEAATPMFGQAGIDDVAMAIDAKTIEREKPAPKAVVVSVPQNTQFNFVPEPNSSAEQLYRDGVTTTAPVGRFDDFSAVVAAE